MHSRHATLIPRHTHILSTAPAAEGCEPARASGEGETQSPDQVRVSVSEVRSAVHSTNRPSESQISAVVCLRTKPFVFADHLWDARGGSDRCQLHRPTDPSCRQQDCVAADKLSSATFSSLIKTGSVCVGRLERRTFQAEAAVYQWAVTRRALTQRLSRAPSCFSSSSYVSISTGSSNTISLSLQVCVCFRFD